MTNLLDIIFRKMEMEGQQIYIFDFFLKERNIDANTKRFGRFSVNSGFRFGKQLTVLRNKRRIDEVGTRKKLGLRDE